MLKNITRVVTKTPDGGHTIHRLIDPDGNFIDAFDRFSEHLVLQNYCFTTRKRYSEACERFIDYLFEVGVLGAATATSKLAQAIAHYPILLRDGPTCGKFITCGYERESTLLSDYAKAVGMKQGLSRKSFGPTLAAINLFLTLSQELARRDQSALKETEALIETVELTIDAIEGLKQVPTLQKKRLKQNSMLASVKRRCGELKQPRGIKSPIRHSEQIDLRRLDFPLTEFANLVSAATNFRDKALWTLLAASGIRESDALNLQLEHIDPVTCRVYVKDPDHLRFGAQMTKNETQRFKGRSTSKTFLFEPLRTEFFKSYETVFEI